MNLSSIQVAQTKTHSNNYKQNSNCRPAFGKFTPNTIKYNNEVSSYLAEHLLNDENFVKQFGLLANHPYYVELGSSAGNARGYSTFVVANYKGKPFSSFFRNNPTLQDPKLETKSYKEVLQEVASALGTHDTAKDTIKKSEDTVSGLKGWLNIVKTSLEKLIAQKNVVQKQIINDVQTSGDIGNVTKKSYLDLKQEIVDKTTQIEKIEKDPVFIAYKDAEDLLKSDWENVLSK